MATTTKRKQKKQPTTQPTTRGVDFTIFHQKYEESLLRPVDEYDDPEDRVGPDVDADNKGRAFLAWRLAEARRAQQEVGRERLLLLARADRARQEIATLKPLAEKGRRLSDRGSRPWAVWHRVVLTLADAHPKASLQVIWSQIRRRARTNPTIIVNTFSARDAECDYVVGRACVDGGHIHWRPADGAPLRSVGREAVLNYVSKHRPRRAP